MAEIWGMALAAGATVYGANQANRGASRAAGAAENASAASITENRRQYNQARADFTPYRMAGYGALDRLMRLYGLHGPSAPATPGSAPADPTAPPEVNPLPYFAGNLHDIKRSGRGHEVNNVLREYEMQEATRPVIDWAPGMSTEGDGRPDLSVFFESPDYQFNLAEGQKAIDRSAAARSGLLSGAAVKAGQRYASGLASSEFGNFYNRLANIAGLGQAATNSTTTAGMNATNNNTSAILNAGNARGSAYLQAGNNNANAANGLASNVLLMQYLNQNRNAVRA